MLYRLLETLSEDVIEDLCATRLDLFKICHAYVTRFLLYVEYLFYFLSLTGSSAAAGKACLYYFKAFQPWPPGTLLRDEGRQERGAQQGCGREIQRINGAARCELKPGPAGK